MHRIPVESSNVASIGYEAGVLEVGFKGGAVYRYANVTRQDYEHLIAAESKGSYFARAIKPHYAATKVEPAKEKTMADQTTPVLRAKMRVTEVLRSIEADGSTGNERVKLTAVYGAEGTDNAQWSKWTPSASFDIWINNPAAFGTLANGHEFYVDFTPAPKANG